MRIGQLSEQTGVTVDTLRFYAREGLLDYTFKGNYWEFSEDQVTLVEHILLLRSLDFTIQEITYVFNASDALLEGEVVQKEKVLEYKDFFEGKRDRLLQQKEALDIAEKRITKVLEKLTILENRETFTL